MRALALAHATDLASPRTLWKSPPASRDTLLTKKPIFMWLRWRRPPDIGNTVHQICERAIPTTILLRCDTAAKPFAADSTPIARPLPSLPRNAPARTLPQSCSWHLRGVSVRHPIRRPFVIAAKPTHAHRLAQKQTRCPAQAPARIRTGSRQ